MSSVTTWALAALAGALHELAGAGSMRSTYNACVRRVRADYGGHGLPYTENGRQIDVYDPLGIQQPDLQPSQAFEAGWNERGAVCVHHLRVAGRLALAELATRHPQQHGALVFNRSNDGSAP